MRWCVRWWLIRPVLALYYLSQIEQLPLWNYDDPFALALRSLCFPSASQTLLASYSSVPFLMSQCHFARSALCCSQDYGGILREALRAFIWAASWQYQQNDCTPSEDSGQPGHPPRLIRVFAVRMKKAWVLSYPLSAQRKLWSDWADAQAELSLRWAQSFYWFWHEVAQIYIAFLLVTFGGHPHLKFSIEDFLW